MDARDHTFASRFCLREASVFARLVRDLRLIRFLLQGVFGWYKARPVREEYSRCREKDEAFYVDRFAKTEPPE